MSGHSVEEVASGVLGRLSGAWNAADGQAFGAPFVDDADFVTIRGDYLRGRDAIAHGHQGIFDTIYRGSSHAYELLRARALAEDVILVHARADLNAPTGPLTGEHSAVATAVLVDRDGEWWIASMHNTLVAPPR